MVPRIMALLTLIVFAGPASAQIVNPTNGHTYFQTDITMPMDIARAQAGVVGGYVTSLNDAAEDQWFQGNFFGWKWIGSTLARVSLMDGHRAPSYTEKEEDVCANHDEPCAHVLSSSPPPRTPR